MSLRIWTKLRTWKLAVTVDVVAPEENASLVAIYDLGEPSERLAGGSVAKVLLVDSGLVAPAQDVVAGLLADDHGFPEAALEVALLGGIARRVDGVLAHRAGVPLSAGRRWGWDGDGDDGDLLARGQSTRNADRSSKERERGVCNHDEAFRFS